MSAHSSRHRRREKRGHADSEEEHKERSPSGSPGRRKPILVVLIARGSTVLCQYAEVNVLSLTTQTVLLLNKVPTEVDQDLLFSHKVEDKDYHFYARVRSGLTYFCMTEDHIKAAVGHAYLQEVEQNFIVQYGTEAPKHAIAYAMDDFKEQLETITRRWARKSHYTAVEEMKEGVEEVKQKLLDSVDKLMVHQEELDTLVGKTKKLEENALQMETSSNKLKCKMQTLNLKMTLIITTVVIVVIYIILASNCGISLRRCFT